jgi:hypothetical protein
MEVSKKDKNLIRNQFIFFDRKNIYCDLKSILSSWSSLLLYYAKEIHNNRGIGNY